MVRSIRSVSKARKKGGKQRIYVRSQKIPIVRDHRKRPVEFGEDPLEARAIPKGSIPGATLPERIVYKKLVEMLGGEHKFVFQRSEGGGRGISYIAGYVIDFVIIDRYPPLALEVLGDFWHQAEDKYLDVERALAVIDAGYAYAELWEHDIYSSDEYLEQLLNEILHTAGRRGY